MTDTQWPRYQVFLQEKVGAPHQDVGSVHAPDPELALLNARDVFVRRPQCLSLWVVPVDVIYSKTAEELGVERENAGGRGAKSEMREEPGILSGGGRAFLPPQSKEAETYLVFCKAKSVGTQTYVGEVQAGSPEEAMQQAVEQFSGDKPPFAWWVIPAASIYHSEPDDVPSMFSPAEDKPFRLSTDFRTHTAMRSIKSKDH